MNIIKHTDIRILSCGSHLCRFSLTISTSKGKSLALTYMDCGDEGQEECGLSVSLVGSSFIVTGSCCSLAHAVFIEMAGKHSSSMSETVDQNFV